jgi:predicted phosphodiesterase
LSSSTPPPIILPEDLKFYYSGGFFNSDASLSLGGETSSFQLISGTLNGLFDRVDTSEAISGDMEYRCVYLRNTSQTRKLLGTKIWIETGTASPDTAIAISIGSSGINGTEPTIPDEGVAPPMNFFEIPLSAPDSPNIGDLYPGDHIGLWIRWDVKTGTTSIGDDFAVIRIDGEREPESITEPLPPPTEPPPTSGCPHGSKWSPTEMRCVDDSTVIICPNGYTYNSSTQRCVPPTTPPPSVGNWVFAAVGDFSCTGDADETMDLLSSKLNKTAGTDIGLFLALGDFSYEDGDQSCWLDNVQDSIGAMYPDHVAPILGNHDDTEDGAASDRSDIIAAFPLIPTEGYYAFIRRNIKFIMMDTQSSYGTTSAQFAFVKAQLESATADPAIKWKIVCYHKPSFTSATDYGPLTDFRTAYHALFDTHKVDLIFNGHNHNYGRSKPVKYNSASPGTPIIAVDQATGNYINVDGRIFITCGTGGRSSHPEFDGAIENFMGFRHSPDPYGANILTLQDNGNQLRVQFITNSNQVLDDFTLSKPGATPPPTGEAVCPQGFHWDNTQGRCIISPEQCPTNYRWEPAQNRCVPSSGNPPPPPGSVDPMIGVEWFYDSTATQNTPQTINAGSYDSVEGILLASGYANVTSMSIGSDGWITIPGAGASAVIGNASTRLGVDYWKKSNFASDERVGRNTAFYFKFIYNDNISIGVVDGCEYPTGVLSPARIFGGFVLSFFGPSVAPDSGFTDGNGIRVNYYYNPTTDLYNLGTQTNSSFSGGRSFEVGKTYEVFGTFRTNRITSSVVVNSWVNFGDGSGWIKTLTDSIFSQSTWSPLSPPSGFIDTEEIASGPPTHDELRRRRLVIRNNNAGIEPPRPLLKVKDIRVGTLPFLSEVNNPPPGGGGGGGGTGTGGVLDSNGIRWFMATGQQGSIGQTRNESSDDRWSGNVSGVSQYGYELTMYLTVGSISSGGHFACKMWGPNHSGSCGHTEGGDCCCWYDLGVRANGDVQQEIERPHPSNDSFNKGKVMQNIGRGIGGQTTGLKWLIYPLTPGGSADNGGIKIKMWVDTDPFVGGKPQNKWRLCMDLVDTGDILGDYPNPDFEHDLEVRNSDSSGQSTYAGGLHWRKIIAGNTDQSGTGSGTGGGTTPPTQPPPSSGTSFKIISWGDNDTTQDAEEVLDMIMTESNVSQYLFAGDGPYSNSGTSWVNMMSSHFNTTLLKSKLMLAQGNHEHPESASQQAENDIEAWMPGLSNATEGLEWLQSKIVGNVFIIVMNSQDSNIDQVGGAQMNWVQARLNEAVAARTAGTIKWIVMMVHKNWFSITNFSPDAFDTRFAYQTMLNNAQVDIMFSGHTHTYQLWKPIVTRGSSDETDQGTLLSGTLSGSNWNFALTHGVMHIINGNGGHEINSFGSNPMPSTILYANDDEFGYTVLEVDGSTLRVIAKSVGGNVRHTVTLIR